VSPVDGVCAEPIKVVPENTSQVEITSAVVSEKKTLIAFMWGIIGLKPGWASEI
jgi:hypothetical protein